MKYLRKDRAWVSRKFSELNFNVQELNATPLEKLECVNW